MSSDGGSEPSSLTARLIRETAQLADSDRIIAFGDRFIS